MKKIVTREWMTSFIEQRSPAEVERMVGRALVAIFRNQTDSEQSCNDTNVHNDIGFSGADARSGCLTAKTYLKNGKLLDWQLAKWTKKTRYGHPRITKYWKQLNDIANQKAGE